MFRNDFKRKMLAGEYCYGILDSTTSGEIVEINEELENDSTLINKDPYGEGWIVLIEPGNLDADLGNLMQGDAVREWLEAELKRAEELKAQGGNEGD